MSGPWQELRAGRRGGRLQGFRASRIREGADRRLRSEYARAMTEALLGGLRRPLDDRASAAGAARPSCLPRRVRRRRVACRTGFGCPPGRARSLRSCSTVLASRSRSFRHQTGSSTRVRLRSGLRHGGRGRGATWRRRRAPPAGLPRSRARADRRSARRPPARAGRRGWRRHALARRAHARRRARVPDERRRAPAARGATRGRRRDGRALRPAARPRPGVRPAPAECRLTSRGRPRAGARAARPGSPVGGSRQARHPARALRARGARDAGLQRPRRRTRCRRPRRRQSSRGARWIVQAATSTSIAPPS